MRQTASQPNDRLHTLRPAVRTFLLAAGAAALWVVAGAGAAVASDASEAAARGAVTYRVYCGRCHGAGGKGDGKLGATLKKKPADLTTIASRNHGVFDSGAIRTRIDGRDAPDEHADSDMPAWGTSMQDPDKDSSQEADIKARIADLVAYIATLQSPPAK